MIELDGFIAVASVAVVAGKACQENGKGQAMHLRKVSVNPRLQAGTGVQLSTIRCQ